MSHNHAKIPYKYKLEGFQNWIRYVRKRDRDRGGDSERKGSNY